MAMDATEGALLSKVTKPAIWFIELACRKCTRLLKFVPETLTNGVKVCISITFHSGSTSHYSPFQTALGRPLELILRYFESWIGFCEKIEMQLNLIHCGFQVTQLWTNSETGLQQTTNSEIWNIVIKM